MTDACGHALLQDCLYSLILGSSGILPLGTAAFILGDESKNESTKMSNRRTKAQQSVYPSCVPLVYQ